MMACFAHNHMSMRQYGLWSRVRQLQKKYGVVLFSAEKISGDFAKDEDGKRNGSSVDVIRDECLALIKSGWFVLLTKQYRKPDGTYSHREIIALSHKEWAQSHPNKCREVTPTDGLQAERTDGLQAERQLGDRLATSQADRLATSLSTGWLQAKQDISNTSDISIKADLSTRANELRDARPESFKNPQPSPNGTSSTGQSFGESSHVPRIDTRPKDDFPHLVYLYDDYRGKKRWGMDPTIGRAATLEETAEIKRRNLEHIKPEVFALEGAER